MERTDFEAHVAERAPLVDHVGKSGAGLERVRMDDGRQFVVKRLRPADDFVMRLTGDVLGREYVLWSSGLLDRLPEGVGHPVIAAWAETDGAVLVMRDLGPTVLSWDDWLDEQRCRWMLERVARLHDAFAGIDPHEVAPGGLSSVADLVSMFTPAKLKAHAEGVNPIPAIALHGWDIFFDTVPKDIAEPVSDLLADMSPLVDAMLQCPTTLVHGDLATVNMALEDDQLVLLDWSMTAIAPGPVDIARFVAGCSSVVEPSREDVIAAYRSACASYDERAMRLGLLTGLLWLGWNKALDAREHPDPAIKAREAEDLGWWVDRGREALDAGLT